MVYAFCFFYNDMDGYNDGDNLSDICSWCNIEREEFYMGGGLYMYKCPKCGGKMELKKQ